MRWEMEHIKQAMHSGPIHGPYGLCGVNYGPPMSEQNTKNKNKKEGKGLNLQMGVLLEPHGPNVGGPSPAALHACSLVSVMLQPAWSTIST